MFEGVFETGSFSCVSGLGRLLPWLKKDHPDQSLITFLFFLDNELESGKTPFRFENMWLESEGFVDIVEDWWEEAEVTGYASYVVASKLNVFMEKLKKWNINVFGDIKNQFLGCERRIMRT